MKLSLWDPSTQASSRSLLTSFFDDWEPFNNAQFRPNVNIKEDEKAYYIAAEVPGIEKENVRIELKNNRLILSGEKKVEHEDKKENFHRIESRYGSFCRSFELPNNVDTDKINAAYKNGILQLTIPKSEEVKPTTIKIN